MAGANERRPDPEHFSGMRKLIRPILSAAGRRRLPVPAGDPLTHALNGESHNPAANSHAEVFYFQKQIQQQTEMTLILEDGEAVHGVLEWHDRCSIKVRAGRHRVLIYKAALKYMYKTSDARTAGNVMK